MIAVDFQVIVSVQQSFYELIGGLHSVETVERNRVLNTGVMSVESDDVVDTHSYEFLQRDRAVQRFPGCALRLEALIEIRHDDSDSTGLALDSRDHTFEVGEMVVRRHVVLETEHLVGLAVIDDIHQDVEVHTSDRLIQYALAFTCPEAGHF